MKHVTVLGVLILVFVVFIAGLSADSSQQLTEKQKRVQESVRALLESMDQVAKNIAEGNPDLAKRLKEAIQMVRDSQLEGDMDAVMEALEEGDFFSALLKGETAQEAIDELIDTLLKREDRDPDFNAIAQ